MFAKLDDFELDANLASHFPGVYEDWWKYFFHTSKIFPCNYRGLYYCYYMHFLKFQFLGVTQWFIQLDVRLLIWAQAVMGCGTGQSWPLCSVGESAWDSLPRPLPLPTMHVPPWVLSPKIKTVFKILISFFFILLDTKIS